MRCSITLVHGTWARGAKWALPGSAMREYLARELARQGLEARFADPPFQWSGANTHTARRRAASDLRLHLEAQLRDHPGDRHFLIAHSHGGNVALRCLNRSPHIASRIDGLVNLATPFLGFARREAFFAYFPVGIRRAADQLMERSGCLFTGAGLALVFLPIAYLTRSATEFRNRYMFDQCAAWTGWNCLEAVRIAAIGLPSLYAIVLMSILLRRGYRSARDEGRAAADRRFRAILRHYGYFQPCTTLHAVPVLSCSSSLDEALGILHGSWWLHRAGALAARLASLAGLLAVVAASLFALVTVVNLSFWLVISVEDAEFIVLAIAVLVLAFTLYATSALVSWILRLGAAAPNLGLGWVEANLFVKVRARRRFQLYHLHSNRRFPVRMLWSAARFSLFHSRLYASPVAMREVAEWIAGRLAWARPAPRQRRTRR